MQYITKLKIASVHQLCDALDKSTEFMLQLMQDTCKVDLDTVMNYMNLPQADKIRLFQDLNDLLAVMVQLEDI